MECKIEENILWVSGKLDSSTSPEFEAAIARLAESLVSLSPQAVLEFSGIETLTSAPLRAMLTLAKRLHASKGSVVLAAPSPVAVEALKVSGFMRLQVFQMVASIAELKEAPAPSLSPSPAAARAKTTAKVVPPEPARPPAAGVAPKPAAAPAPARQTPAAPRQIPVSAKEPKRPGWIRRLFRSLAFWKR
jgi:anti-anti-sigma factor